MMSVDPSAGVGAHATCASCGSPVEAGQRYCLECGERVGPRDPKLVQLLRRNGAQPPAEVEPAAAATAARRSGLILPSPRVSALLVLVFLGFGVLIGGAASSRVDNTLAASGHAVRLVVPQTATAPAESASTAPPASSETATPASSSSSAAAETPPTSAASTAAAPASASSGLGQSSAPASSAPSGSSGAEAESPAASAPAPTSGAAKKLPPVKHVFLIVLSDQPYASVFGPASTAPYLSQTLEQRGELLVRYDAVAHEQLPNGVALISGQGPTVETAANCPTYSDIAPATVGAEQQVTGHGCVYPRATQTIADQLAAKHLTWRAYVQGMDEAGAQAAACGHPALGQADPTATVPLPAGQSYATFRNPFVYFHSLIDAPACATGDVGLKQLSPDLASSGHTPSVSYIVPDRCHDGSPAPCAPGAPAGLAPADAFLKTTVPKILASKAYKDGGLLVITVDAAPSTGPFGDSSSCCGQPHFPNLPAPVSSVPGLLPKGGGEVGALLLSPFVKPGTTSQEPLNHFSLLRTIEDLFGLKHLGYAGAPGVTSFEPSLFSAGMSG